MHTQDISSERVVHTLIESQPYIHMLWSPHNLEVFKCMVISSTHTRNLVIVAKPTYGNKFRRGKGRASSVRLGCGQTRE
jgi:hypothetical protein